MMQQRLEGILDALDVIIASTPSERIPAVLAALSARVAVASTLLLTLKPELVARETPEENLSILEAARRLGVSKDFLYRHARALPFTVRIGRRVLFSASGLERWNRQRQGQKV